MFVIDTYYFNLDQIYDSGQAPRWIKLAKSNYIIPHKNKAVKVVQKMNPADWDNYRLTMNCSEDDFFNVWFDYFDLQMDCLSENDKVKKLGGKFKIIANRGKGIHVLNQEPFEAYVFSKLISKVGFSKAGELMNRIAQTYGIRHVQSMREAGRVVWYEWPTPEIMLEKLSKEKLSSGKVKPFLKRLCDAIVNNNFDVTQSENELFRLFGMHDKTVFPTTTIEDILEKNFDCVPEEFADWYLDGIENKGLTYMYIIHHINNKPKEMMSHGISR